MEVYIRRFYESPKRNRLEMNVINFMITMRKGIKNEGGIGHECFIPY